VTRRVWSGVRKRVDCKTRACGVHSSAQRNQQTVELAAKRDQEAMSDRKRANRLAALAELKRTREGGAREWKVRNHCGFD